ncbi:MAG: type II toxin-antitoxin system VapC family toxin [Elusimicrobiales bacterium]
MKIIVDTCVFVDSFDPASCFHDESLSLLTELSRRKILISMPAHGWFEVQCALQHLTDEHRFVPPVILGEMSYTIELIHIDNNFIERYKLEKIPYIKAGDHIFIAVAKKNNYPLITNDRKMIEVAKRCGIRVFTPGEFVRSGI